MLHSIPSAHMFLPRRASDTIFRHSRSIGISITSKPSLHSRSQVSR